MVEDFISPPPMPDKPAYKNAPELDFKSIVDSLKNSYNDLVTLSGYVLGCADLVMKSTCDESIFYELFLRDIAFKIENICSKIEDDGLDLEAIQEKASAAAANQAEA